MRMDWRLVVATLVTTCLTSLTTVTMGLSGVTPSMATLDQNGYANIIVAVDPRVSEDDCQTLIANLKNGFKEASRMLLPALHFKAYFKSVKIVLPETWRREECLRDSLGFATKPLVSAADFRVAPANPVHGDDAYTLQPHGCGKRGLYTHLTPGFLKNAEEASRGTIGRVIVQEWAKLRYGVYEEYGFPGDSMYPHFYTTYRGNWTKEMRPTGCSNQPVLGTTPRNCNDNTCKFFPSVADNGNVTSSLMYLRNLPNITHFCDSKTHVKQAPTKHNVLCNGKDVDSIISANDDFKDVFEVAAPVGDTEFEILRASSRRVVFALDRSNATSEQNVWSALGPRLYALLHVLNRTEPNMEIGLVEFGGDKTETESSGGMRSPGGFLDRSPLKTYTTEAPHGCIDCGLSHAWQLLRARTQPTDGMEIVVLTRQMNSVNLDKLVTQFRNAGIILHAIVVKEGPSTRFDDVERAASVTNGRVFRIKYGETLVRTGASVAAAFEALFPSVRSTKLHEKFLNPKLSNSATLSGNFTLEGGEERAVVLPVAPYRRPTGSDLDVFAFFYQTFDEMDIPRQFVVESKIGGYRQNGFRAVGELPVFLAHFNGDVAREGDWQYRLTPGVKREEYLVEAHGHYDQASGSNGLNFLVWTSWDALTAADLQNPEVIETIPLKLFAKVEKDGKPVFDARVWATVTIKRQQEEDFSATRAMLDDGRGDPDIQRGDGVYTTYFTNFVTATSVSEYRFVFACDDNGGHARVPSDDQHKSTYEYGFEYFKQHPEEEAAAGRQGSDDEKTAGGVPVTTATPVHSAPMSDEHARKERQVAARSLPIDDDRRNEDYWDANAAPRPLGSTSGSQKTGVSACCGSEPVDVVLEPSGPFSSFSSGGLETIIFNVPATSGSLIFPPSRVMDLKVDVFDVSGVFRLTWSAPGDEYTVGTVSQYVIAYGEDWDSVAYYQDGVKTFVAPMEPHSYGSAETLDLNATDLGLHAGTVYYFSVRGCDQASKCGSPSNVVLASASPTAGPEFANAASAPGFAGLPGNKLAGLSTGETFGIVFGCFGFVLLMIAACVFYMVFVRRRKSSSDKAAMARKTGGSGGSSGGGSNGGMTGSGGGVANNAVRHSTPTPYVSEEEGNKMTGNNGDISTISNGQVGSPSYVPASQLLGAHEKQMQTNGDVYGTYQETTVYAKETEEAYIPDYSQGYDVGSYYYAEGYDAYGMPVAGYTGYTQQAYVQQGSGRSSRHSDSTTNSIPSQRYDTQQAFEHYAGAYDGPGAEQLYARPNKMGPNTSYDQLQMAGSRHSNVSHQTPPQSGTAPRIRNITQV